MEHVRNQFGKDTMISHVVLTHADADHASGLREVISELGVCNLWLHIPWMSAAAARPYFANKSWTDDGLRAAIGKEYDLIVEIVKLAIEKQIAIRQPFASTAIGP